MMEQRIKSVIRNIPDFPKPGILFKDITPLLLDAVLCRDITDEFVKRFEGMQLDAIIAIESRGFFFGTLLAQRLQLPFIPIRKEGKLPGDTIAYKYDLEYGSAVIEMHKEDLKPGSNVLIHDDLLATGGTAAATAALVAMQQAKVAAFSFIVTLEFLHGRSKLKNYSNNIISLASYK